MKNPNDKALKGRKNESDVEKDNDKIHVGSLRNIC